MCNTLMRALGALFLLVQAAAAEDGRPTLEELLAKLAKAETVEQAFILELEIRDRWTRSDSPTLELLMARSIQETQDGGDTAVAEQLLTEIIALAPEFTEAWSRRAALYLQQEAFDKALVDLAQVVARDPRRFDALNALGEIFDALEADREALAAFRAAKALHPLLPGLDKQIERLTTLVEGQEI